MADPVEEYLDAFNARCDAAGVPASQRSELLVSEAEAVVKRYVAGERVSGALIQWALELLNQSKGGAS